MSAAEQQARPRRQTRAPAKLNDAIDVSVLGDSCEQGARQEQGNSRLNSSSRPKRKAAVTSHDLGLSDSDSEAEEESDSQSGDEPGARGSRPGPNSHKVRVVRDKTGRATAQVASLVRWVRNLAA
jgi:hypothetical protein